MKPYILTPGQLAELHAEYLAGTDSAILALRHGRTRGWLMMQFAVRGLPGRPRQFHTLDPKVRNQKQPLVKTLPIERQARKARPALNPQPSTLNTPAPSPLELRWRQLRASMNIQPVSELLAGCLRQ